MQTKPLVKLQTESDAASGHRVLTCYLLPQQTRSVQGNHKPNKNNTCLLVHSFLFFYWPACTASFKYAVCNTQVVCNWLVYLELCLIHLCRRWLWQWQWRQLSSVSLGRASRAATDTVRVWRYVSAWTRKMLLPWLLSRSCFTFVTVAGVAIFDTCICGCVLSF